MSTSRCSRPTIPAPLATVTVPLQPDRPALARMPKPVIAAVNGMAAGAGAGLAFACDFRIARPDGRVPARLRQRRADARQRGVVDAAAAVGPARATALALLAEPVTAEAALEMGLVNAVVEPDHVLPAAQELAARLAAGPTAAYAAIKRVDRVRGHVHLAECAGQGGRAADRDGRAPRITATRPPRSWPSRSRSSPVASCRGPSGLLTAWRFECGRASGGVDGSRSHRQEVLYGSR